VTKSPKSHFGGKGTLGVKFEIHTWYLTPKIPCDFLTSKVQNCQKITPLVKINLESFLKAISLLPIIRSCN
jgi:hypothetical protein